MEFRILGPLEVWSGRERVALGGPQNERLLAALLLGGGRVVPLAALVDALWDEDPPPTAKHQVHKVIAKLRQLLPGIIHTDGPGYRVRADAVDLERFERLAATGTIAGLTEALSLWRGPALAGVDGAALRTAAAALDERRLAVTEELTDLRLAAGESAALVVELPRLIEANPYRERLRAQLMIALYRGARQADALAVYQQTRALFDEELGVEPGAELAELHQRVLRADPALDLPARDTGRSTLPYDLPDFAGRRTELAAVLAATEAAPIVAIDGMAGVGKTALAVHVAHRVAARFPHGRLLLDLRGHTPGAVPVDPEVALAQLLGMLGVAEQSIPEGLEQRAARWRAELADRKVLLVLDNAASAAQVRPLLPSGPGCLVVITSRRRLGVLDGAEVHSLEPMPDDDAAVLFANVVGVRRAAAEPDAAAEVVGLCGRLPLALRIAATRLAARPVWTVADLARRLRDASGRLAQLTVADRGVGAAFALSHQQLDPDEQRVLALLGRHPGSEFEKLSVAALAGVSPSRAEELLESLLDAHLLSQRTADRYTCHDLVREFALELPADEAEPMARLRDFYLAATTAAADRISPEGRRFDPVIALPPAELPRVDGLDQALAWLAAEHDALMAIAGGPHGWQLTLVLRAYFEHRGHFGQWRATHERALRETTDNLRATALLEFNLAAVAMWTERPDDGMTHLRRAMAAVDAGDPVDQQLRATILTNQGMLAHQQFRDVEATGYLRAALAIEHDDVRVRALTVNNLALTEGRLGAADKAMRHHREALALARAARLPTAERGVLLSMGETALRLGLPAEEAFREALDLARAGRFRIQEALALDGLAHATGDQGHWRAALAILTDLGVPRAGVVARHLANPGLPCCELCGEPDRAAHPQPHRTAHLP
ncbi:AfsR/SARP family transcriptional regulator [Labedaea rhizosphaerae]|uniref:DNA-binding SARP family transcriptional activator n=1 Tax=Labedaea rhizosphaerae TaxID=598644 RepID=A0A4R6RXM2_LABRH|nr:BTAD domain-containing putative transcriptional regulator [Labedaea rhizosphaerae]TDP91842.1 DNA-binding SARP family transcriptional activator [Labedaea rhizosphaerae]